MVNLKITEIFHSIQGESSLVGERFSFVRLTGCPLRCTYCDTQYSYAGGKWMPINEIVSTVRNHNTKWVLITGGEPLAQKHTLLLVKALVDSDFQVSIETDGEEDVRLYVKYAKIVMDIKTPSSGIKPKKCFDNLIHLKPTDELKFVIGNRNDYDWSRQVCQDHELTKRFMVLFSPVFNELSLKDLADWMLFDRLDVRLHTQLHKHIWGNEIRGV